MSAQGLLLIAAGLGLLWSARANARDVASIGAFRYRHLKERGWPAWALCLLAPAPNRSPRVLAVSNSVLAVAVLIAGVLNLAGVWHV